jgi:F420H(2)-dependent quinone reductase
MLRRVLAYPALQPRGKAFVLDRLVAQTTGWSPLLWRSSYTKAIPTPPCLVLTTIRRRSGALRRVVLPYVHDAGRIIVVGSLGGGPADPQWARNLRANPRSWIRIRRADHAVTARLLEGSARADALRTVIARRPHVLDYEIAAQGHGRAMPIFLLTPSTTDGPAPIVGSARPSALSPRKEESEAQHGQ